MEMAIKCPNSQSNGIIMHYFAISITIGLLISWKMWFSLNEWKLMPKILMESENLVIANLRIHNYV